MVIGVDAGCLGISDKRLQVGVYQVAYNLLFELGKIDKKNKYILYSFDPIDKRILRKFGNRMENKVLRPKKGLDEYSSTRRILERKARYFLSIESGYAFLSSI